MVSRIKQRFSTLAAQGRTAFVPYITAGDPDLATTGDILCALADSGADVIELGIPFSDPMADGPVIEAAMVRALEQGVHFAQVLEVVRDFRAKHPDVGLVLFGYLNPIFAVGLQQACRLAEEAGADGFLVVDLPPEEASQLADPAKANGLDLIALFTPTSDDDRVATIAQRASGFAYYVSTAAVTGDAIAALDTVAARVARVRKISGLPVCVGFGIRTPEDGVRVAEFADGVVVGTALVQAIAQADAGDEARVAGALVARFRRALDER